VPPRARPARAEHRRRRGAHIRPEARSYLNARQRDALEASRRPPARSATRGCLTCHAPGRARSWIGRLMAPQGQQLPEVATCWRLDVVDRS
jgi:hypothetical protein